MNPENKKQPTYLELLIKYKSVKKRNRKFVNRNFLDKKYR